MNTRRIDEVFNEENALILSNCLKNLSIYNGKGKTKSLQVSEKLNYRKILGDLDLDTIHQNM